MKSIAVLMGGRSPEHWVSFKSGLFILGLLDPDKYRVHAVYVKPDGKVASADEYRASFDRFVSENDFTLYTHQDDMSPNIMVRLRGLEPGRTDLIGAIRDGFWDMIFPVFHGRNGEDGTIQGLAEFMGIPYAGCNLPGSAIGMDKVLTKRLAAARGIASTPDVVIHRDQWKMDPDVCLDRCEETLGWPVFVKPVRLGSSIGVCKARDRKTLLEALEEAFTWDLRVLVEKEVPGIEYSVGVIGTTLDCHTSSVSESTLRPDFFDYDAKYGVNSPDDIVPARLSQAQTELLRHEAAQVFQALDMDGICRIDLFLTDQGPILNEVNTMPGLSAFAPFVIAWEHAGISKKALVERIVEHAWHRGKNP